MAALHRSVKGKPSFRGQGDAFVIGNRQSVEESSYSGVSESPHDICHAFDLIAALYITSNDDDAFSFGYLKPAYPDAGVREGRGDLRLAT